MAKVSVLGGSPVTLVTDKGTQVSIPLSELSFNNGQLVTTDWSGWATYQAFADPRLKDLVGRGLLRPAPAPPAKPAMILKALDPGSTGNSIELAISKVVTATPAKNTTLEMTVTVVEVYDKVTKANIVDILGSTATNGSRPGMAFVSTAPSGALTVVAEKAFDTATKKWAGATLELTAHRDPDGANTPLKAKIETSDGAHKLTMTWTKTVPATTKLNDLVTAPLPFGHILEIQEPPDGWGVPTPGVYVLKGGSDVAAPTTAQAAVMSA